MMSAPFAARATDFTATAAGRRTMGDAQADFAHAGLTGLFWRLDG